MIYIWHNLKILRKVSSTTLLCSIINEAKEYGCQRILLDTSDMGKHLYEKYDFISSKTAMAYYPFGIIPYK